MTMSDADKTLDDAQSAATVAHEGDGDGAGADAAARVAELEFEVGALKDKLLRALADMENVRRRAERQTAEERTYAIERFARDMLSVSDNFARALEAVDAAALAEMSEKGRSLFDGVAMTHKELHAVFARHGVKAVSAAPGDAFNPHIHEAVTQIPSPHPKGTIAQTFAPGWTIGDRVLRAAMCAVSAGE